ncbi:putative inactive ribonuclease 11 [Tamandua tetradactyla]|uniref:putative inactive ribonuclease 11 n=1 Tax=Tamandua tetradactyla TaxID=48850 RepID=UPI00405386D1
METFSLLLLGMGLMLSGASESTVEIIKEEFAKEEMEYDIAKSDEVKQTTEVSMNLTLLDKNTSLSMSSSLLTFRKLHYNFPKGNSPDNGNEYCDPMMVQRMMSEANGSCKLNKNCIHGTMEMIHQVHKVRSCKCGQNSGISFCDSPELETTKCQLNTEKQFSRCQHHSVTLLKKMLIILTGHSLMSWLVSISKL